jgi:hypothetical protein
MIPAKSSKAKGTGRSPTARTSPSRRAFPPKKPGEPESPEKSDDIHGAPETPV